MSQGRSIDVVARDRHTESVVLMSSVRRTDAPSVELLGSIQTQPEPGYLEPRQVSVAATINTEDGADLHTVLDLDAYKLQLVNAAGVGLTVTSYRHVQSIGGKYDIHSGVVTEDEGTADAFAISDPEPISITIGVLALAACLALHAGHLWLINQTLDDYRRRGYVPQYTISGGLFSVVTCKFKVQITALDPQGRIVESKSVDF